MPFHRGRLILAHQLDDLFNTVVNIALFSLNRYTPFIETPRKFVLPSDVNINTVVILHILDALTTLSDDPASRGVRNNQLASLLTFGIDSMRLALSIGRRLILPDLILTEQDAFLNRTLITLN